MSLRRNAAGDALIDGGLRKLFRHHLPEVHWLTVETAGTESGVPDLNGCFAGVEFWIECKLTAGMAVALRPHQIGWLLRRSRAGGRIFVAVRRNAVAGTRREACDELWLIPGAEAEALATDGLRAGREAGRWPGGAARWDWGAIRVTLLSSSLSVSPKVRKPR